MKKVGKRRRGERQEKENMQTEDNEITGRDKYEIKNDNKRESATDYEE